DDFRSFFKADKQREKQNLYTLVAESMKLLEGGMKSRKITLENDVGRELDIDVFSNEFKQVLINIVNNAIDTIMLRDVKDGNIRISSGRVETGTAIYIQDNGHGIQAEDKEKIFEPYFTTKSALNGTGLGLYISKIIIEDHHKGKLRFENSQNGALFTIVIPDNLA
ncbi:MAG: HAMP domain-containing sensor histidine kinase, partial [Sulfurimonadaceae bacterium]|nr:HAMP domain-containing sensor histidine kinase [Sulfurimonadaceae bacterium]